MPRSSSISWSITIYLSSLTNFGWIITISFTFRNDSDRDLNFRLKMCVCVCVCVCVRALELVELTRRRGLHFLRVFHRFQYKSRLCVCACAPVAAAGQNFW